MDFFRGIVKIRYGGEEVRMNLVQEPRENGSTEDEDFTSATETESSSESDPGDVDLVLTIRNPPINDKEAPGFPLCGRRSRTLTQIPRSGLSRRWKRTTLSPNPLMTYAPLP